MKTDACGAKRDTRAVPNFKPLGLIIKLTG